MKYRTKRIRDDEAKGMVQTLLVPLKGTEQVSFRSIKEDTPQREEELVVDCTAAPELIISMLSSQKYMNLRSLKRLEIRCLGRANQEVKQSLGNFLRLV